MALEMVPPWVLGSDEDCEDCDDERWLPNDEAESADDPAYKPCPTCNPRGVLKRGQP